MERRSEIIKCKVLSRTPPLLTAAASSLPTDFVPPRNRFESAEHELETLRAQVVSINQEITALQARARAAEQRDKIRQDMISKLEYKLEYAEYRIQ
ncbi:hypothetical protein Tco_0452764 [Tanacetum coccineum]